MRPKGFAHADDHWQRAELSRRRILQGMLATAGAAAAGSGLSTWMTQAPARASGLVLPPGSRPDPAKPEGIDTLPQIEHIVIYMQENQSYDHYFGTLSRGDGFTIGPGPSKQVLVRAVGPTLGVYLVPDTLADPKLELYNSAGIKIAENDNFNLIALLNHIRRLLHIARPQHL